MVSLSFLMLSCASKIFIWKTQGSISEHLCHTHTIESRKWREWGMDNPESWSHQLMTCVRLWGIPVSPFADDENLCAPHEWGVGGWLTWKATCTCLVPAEVWVPRQDHAPLSLYAFTSLVIFHTCVTPHNLSYWPKCPFSKVPEMPLTSGP